MQFRIHQYLRYAAAAIALLLAFSAYSGCGRMAKSAKRGAERRVEREVARKSKDVLARDLARDAASSIRRLETERTVYRYTTRQAAERELRYGIAPGTHLTSTARSGRPLSRDSARAKYGLPSSPEVRMTVVLPKGTEVRFNRALGGTAGIGEITTAGRVPSVAIKEVVSLKRP